MFLSASLFMKRHNCNFFGSWVEENVVATGDPFQNEAVGLEMADQILSSH
jgi:hypothetical protein